MKQTWVIRYLRIDGDRRRLPLSFTVTVEAAEQGESRRLAHERFYEFARRENLNVLFLNSETINSRL